MELVELEEQRPGENRETKINRTYIESGEFRRKFDLISNDPDLNRLLYQISKKMLYHRNGTLFEDMYWIDLETKEVFAEVLDSTSEQSISYSKTLEEKISHHESILTIHSHPSSCPPSVDDFNSNNERGYNLGIVVCHNGDVYLYRSNERVEPNYYKIVVENKLKEGYNIREAQILAIKRVSENFQIQCKEVLV